MRIISLIFIAIITFVIVLMVKRPELLKDLWLWLIGFSGVLLHALQGIRDDIRGLFSRTLESAMKKKTEITAKLKTKKV